MGVATVGVVHTTVKRHFGAAAGLIAGVALALTPVAALMFMFNNPDALLTLLMALGAWATMKAIEQASPKWMMIVGVFIGLGFLTKTLQVLLVVPFFGLAYLVAAPTTLRKRIVHSPAGRRHDGALRRVVGRDRRAHAGLGTSLHRRQPDELLPRADVRLQRSRAAER